MKNIVLIGFMGTGKTSAGKLLATRLGCGFVDTDAKIEADNNMTIPEIFSAHGEPYFRELEAAAVREAAQSGNTVISTGGGVVLRSDNMAALRQGGWIIALTAPVDVIIERTERNADRPLLETADRRCAAEKLLAERAALYSQADYTVDTASRTPLQVAEEIIEFVKRMGDLRA